MQAPPCAPQHHAMRSAAPRKFPCTALRQPKTSPINHHRPTKNNVMQPPLTLPARGFAQFPHLFPQLLCEPIFPRKVRTKQKPPCRTAHFVPSRFAPPPSPAAPQQTAPPRPQTRKPLPPSAREVSTRSVYGGRDVVRAHLNKPSVGGDAHAVERSGTSTLGVHRPAVFASYSGRTAPSAPTHVLMCRVSVPCLSLWERWPSAARTERANDDHTGPLSHLR